MPDNFYPRLDFYRMLHAGMTNLTEMALALRVSVRTLQRWKAGYDPRKGPYGSLEDVSVLERLGFPQESPEESGGQTGLADMFGVGAKRGVDEIIWALRRIALEGNVPAAKLLLTEYQEHLAGEGDVLTVDRAVELLREWSNETSKGG